MKSYNNIFVGVAIGVVGAIIGFLGFGLIWSFQNGTTLSYFINDVFIGSPFFKDKIITISVIFDVVLFYFLMKKQLYEICKGILLVLLISIPIIIYYH